MDRKVRRGERPGHWTLVESTQPMPIGGLFQVGLLLINEGGGTRTHDLGIKSPLLYQLSYAPSESLNLLP